MSGSRESSGTGEESSNGVHSCDRCGRPIGEKDIRYIVQIRVFAAPDPPVIDDDEWRRDHEKEMREIIECSKNRTAEDLMNDVYASFDLTLCRFCQKEYIEDPLPRKGRRSRRPD